jgi:HD-like signal output (HDOD) protein
MEDNPQTRDSAFLLGLVHDIGRTVLLATAAPPLVAAGEPPTNEAIEAAGNEIRCELGAIVLAAWMFDDEMVDAVTWQERPDDCPQESRLLTQGLYAADTLVNLGERGWRPGQNEQMDDIVRELLEPMGVEFERSEEILLLVEGGLAAFTKLI